jgi:hypothetical protein
LEAIGPVALCGEQAVSIAIADQEAAHDATRVMPNAIRAAARFNRDISFIDIPRSGRRLGLGLSRRAYVLSGRRPKPDVGNLVKEQAHAPLPASRLDMRACHPASDMGPSSL